MRGGGSVCGLEGASMKTTISIYVDRSIIRTIDQIADETGKSRGDVVALLLEHYQEERCKHVCN
jgi:metal-responsive CopG/Arc/MetJ family transcriptional regulator